MLLDYKNKSSACSGEAFAHTGRRSEKRLAPFPLIVLISAEHCDAFADCTQHLEPPSSHTAYTTAPNIHA